MELISEEQLLLLSFLLVLSVVLLWFKTIIWFFDGRSAVEDYDYEDAESPFDHIFTFLWNNAIKIFLTLSVLVLVGLWSNYG